MAENDTEPVPVGAADPSARIAALERENAALRIAIAAAQRRDPRPARGHAVRVAVSTILIVVGALLAPAAVVANWVQRELTDTDRYVATVGPLASEPTIQAGIATRLTDAVMEQIDVSALVGDAVGALEDEGVAPRLATALAALERPITGGVTSFVHGAATRLTESDAFARAWVEANRIAHEQTVAVMRGDEDNVLQIGDEGRLSIQLSGMIDLLKTQLVDAGFGLAGSLPEVDASFTIVETSQLVQIQDAYQQLVILGTWLPWVSLALVAAGVLTAARRPRALVVAGFSVTAGMLVLAVGLYYGRILYLDALSESIQRLDAAGVVFDQVVSFIRVALRTVGVLALLVALAGYVSGSSDSARRLRAGMNTGLARVGSWADHRGYSAGPLGDWLGSYKALVRATIISVAGLTVLLASSPTPALVVTVAVVAVVLIGVVELLTRSPRAPAEAPSGR
jgi:hypothetical protein